MDEDEEEEEEDKDGGIGGRAVDMNDQSLSWYNPLIMINEDQRNERSQ